MKLGLICHLKSIEKYAFFGDIQKEFSKKSLKWHLNKP